MSEECSKASTAGRLHAFLQSQSGISGMKNGEEATLMFRVTIRIQELRNMVGLNHPGTGMGLDFLSILFSGADYLIIPNQAEGRGL